MDGELDEITDALIAAEAEDFFVAQPLALDRRLREQREQIVLRMCAPPLYDGKQVFAHLAPGRLGTLEIDEAVHDPIGPVLELDDVAKRKAEKASDVAERIGTGELRDEIVGTVSKTGIN